MLYLTRTSKKGFVYYDKAESSIFYKVGETYHQNHEQMLGFLPVFVIGILLNLYLEARKVNFAICLLCMTVYVLLAYLFWRSKNRKIGDYVKKNYEKKRFEELSLEELRELEYSTNLCPEAASMWTSNFNFGLYLLTVMVVITMLFYPEEMPYSICLLVWLLTCAVYMTCIIRKGERKKALSTFQTRIAELGGAPIAMENKGKKMRARKEKCQNSEEASGKHERRRTEK